MTARMTSRRAFTLVEVIVSLFLVVMLILGVYEVFNMSSKTVGVGQAVSTIARDARTAQAIMQYDGRNWLKDAPAFVIVNYLDPGTGLRRDFMAFPARGMYRRHTIDNVGVNGRVNESREAWIWYGHCTGADAQAPTSLGAWRCCSGT